MRVAIISPVVSISSAFARLYAIKNALKSSVSPLNDGRMAEHYFTDPETFALPYFLEQYSKIYFDHVHQRDEAIVFNDHTINIGLKAYLLWFENLIPDYALSHLLSVSKRHLERIPKLNRIIVLKVDYRSARNEQDWIIRKIKDNEVELQRFFDQYYLELARMLEDVGFSADKIEYIDYFGE